MKNRSIALAMLPLVLAGPLALRAQAAAPAAGGKVGVINIQAAIAGTTEGKKVITDLQKKYQPRQQELQRLQQEIQAIQDQLTKQGPALSDEEQGRLSREAEEKQTQLKRSSEDAQNDFNHDRDDAINRIGQKMVQVIRQYASRMASLWSLMAVKYLFTTPPPNLTSPRTSSPGTMPPIR